MSKPTIYLLDGSTALTGAFVCARNIARVLSDQFKVVLIISDNANIAQDEFEYFSDVKRLPIRNLRRSIWAIATYIPSLLIASVMLRWHMRRDQVSLLIINDFNLMQGAVARLLGYRGKIVTWVRINPKAFGRISVLWLEVAAKSSDRIVAVSNYIKGLVPGRLQAILLYDGIEPKLDTLNPDNSDCTRTFVFVGNYIPGKGQDIAVNALARVVSDFPDASIEFYGGDMDLEKNRSFRDSLVESAIALGVGENVFFGGFVEAPAKVLNGKLASLNLSRSESFSMTVLEASACGLAVIATRCGGPEEIIEDGKTGILIPVDDVQSCAEAMISLCRDPTSAKHMGKAGGELVKSKFTEAAFRQGLLEILDID